MGLNGGHGSPPRVRRLLWYINAMFFLLGCSDSSVTKNDARPEATISAPADGASVREGEEVALVGVAGDPDDASSTLTATWYAGADLACTGAAPADDGTTTCA